MFTTISKGLSLGGPYYLDGRYAFTKTTANFGKFRFPEKHFDQTTFATATVTSFFNPEFKVTMKLEPTSQYDLFSYFKLWVNLSKPNEIPETMAFKEAICNGTAAPWRSK